MVSVFGTNITAAYTGGVSVIAIYTGGVKVWPSSSPEYSYYINWTPTTLKQSFKIEGSTYNMSDYSGHFTWETGIITSNAFSWKSITTLDTNAIGIGVNAFKECNSLSSALMSKCSYISDGAFANTIIKSTLTLPVCTYIGPEAFSGCQKLTSISLPKCTEIGYKAFYLCNGLTGTLYLPACTSIGRMGFFNTQYSSVNLPVCTYLSNGAFSDCGSLTTVSLPKCSYIANSVFTGCPSLTTVKLGYSSVCYCAGSDVFPYSVTQFYVPASLVSKYKATTPWIYWSSRIYSIS